MSLPTQQISSRYRLRRIVVARRLNYSFPRQGTLHVGQRTVFYQLRVSEDVEILLRHLGDRHAIHLLKSTVAFARAAISRNESNTDRRVLNNLPIPCFGLTQLRLLLSQCRILLL